ncbi:MAG: hypothetical protein ACLRSW_09885 [Christensenellaceae bacterium]
MENKDYRVRVTKCLSEEFTQLLKKNLHNRSPCGALRAYGHQPQHLTTTIRTCTIPE